MVEVFTNEYLEQLVEEDPNALTVLARTASLSSYMFKKMVGLKLFVFSCRERIEGCCIDLPVLEVNSSFVFSSVWPEMVSAFKTMDGWTDPVSLTKTELEARE